MKGHVELPKCSCFQCSAAKPSSTDNSHGLCAKSNQSLLLEGAEALGSGSYFIQSINTAQLFVHRHVGEVISR